MSKDTRVWMFKGSEARLFEAPEDVPQGEGWRDAPYDLAEEPSPEPKKPKHKTKKHDEPEQPVTDGDSDSD